MMCPNKSKGGELQKMSKEVLERRYIRSILTNRREIIPERNRVWKKRIKVTVGARNGLTSEYKEALRTLTGIIRCIKGAVVYKDGL